jgi:hypothetical protein
MTTNRITSVFEMEGSKIPPGLPIPKGGELFRRFSINDSSFFPCGVAASLLHGGDEGGFDRFSQS